MAADGRERAMEWARTYARDRVMEQFPPLLDTMDARTHKRRSLSELEWRGMQEVIAVALADARAQAVEECRAGLTEAVEHLGRHEDPAGVSRCTRCGHRWADDPGKHWMGCAIGRVLAAHGKVIAALLRPRPAPRETTGA